LLSFAASAPLTDAVCTQDRLGHVGPREVIEESAKDRMVNSATWGKAKRTEKWTSQETEDFYDVRVLPLTPRAPLPGTDLVVTWSQALRQFGTDFEMIAGLFPRRTRRQIKAKWNKEDRVNPKAITAALMTKKSIGTLVCFRPSVAPV
jgi:transcription factor TFIIIB component B''